MLSLNGNKIYLRALEPEDISFLYQLENDTSIWEVSNTQTPYSKYILKQYLENAHQDIYTAKQLRLAICTKENELVGLIDLFDFDPQHKRAGVGIVINQDSQKNKGFGSEALQLIIDYAFSHLQLHQLYANIGSENEPSLKLFTNFGFQQIGIKKDWNFYNNTFQDEILFQLINKI